LLKTLALHRNIGWRLIDLGKHCDLDDSTTHRLMSCLAALRLAKQRPGDRRYVPGPLLYELGLVLPDYHALREACRRNLSRIARRTEWVASMHLRSADESVCIDRTGSSSVQLMVEVGNRRPLAGLAIGAAMLIGLPEHEQRELVSLARKKMNSAKSGRGLACNRILRRSHELGAGLSLGDVIPGIGSVGVAIHNANNQPFAAIGVTGPLPEFTKKRIADVTLLLREEARRIERDHASLIAELSH